MRANCHVCVGRATCVSGGYRARQHLAAAVGSFSILTQPKDCRDYAPSESPKGLSFWAAAGTATSDGRAAHSFNVPSTILRQIPVPSPLRLPESPAAASVYQLHDFCRWWVLRQPQLAASISIYRALSFSQSPQSLHKLLIRAFSSALFFFRVSRSLSGSYFR
jgi:hypothetical protein